MASIENMVYKISTNWEKIRPFIPKFVIKYGINFLIWYSDRKDKKNGMNEFPPANLRFRVHGTPFIESYIGIGKEQKKRFGILFV